MVVWGHIVGTLQVLVVCASLSGLPQNGNSESKSNSYLGELSSPDAVADNSSADSVAAEAPLGPRWEVAPEISWFRYEEPGVMRDEGMFYGVAGSYTRPRERGFFRLEAAFSIGTMDYEGSLQDGTPYSMEDSVDCLLSLRLLGGYPWQAARWDNLFYAGFGYRFLNDDSRSDPAGYDRVSNYFYVPLGVKGHHALGHGWRLGLGGEFDLLLLGVQISYIGESQPQVNAQWPGFGGRASVELRRSDSKMDLALAPFIQYWWIDESSTSSEGWYEPRNNSVQYGLDLIWRF